MAISRFSFRCLTAVALLAACSWFIPLSVHSAAPPVAQKSPTLSPEILAFIKPAEAADGDNDLQKKLKERHNTAVNLLEERVAEYKSGVRELGVVLEAARFVAEAKLTLADSDDAKVKALEQTLAVARQIETQLQQQVDKKFGSKGDLARARYARLGVEVELLKAKSR